MKSLPTILLATMLVACTGEGDPAASPRGPLRIAVLPDQSREQLLDQFGPLRDSLEAESGLQFELEIPHDHEALSDVLAAGHWAMATVGQLTLAQAELRSDATAPDHRELLRKLRAMGYRPAGADEFEDIRIAARSLGLLATAHPL